MIKLINNNLKKINNLLSCLMKIKAKINNKKKIMIQKTKKINKFLIKMFNLKIIICILNKKITFSKIFKKIIQKKTMLNKMINQNKKQKYKIMNNMINLMKINNLI